MRCAEDLGTPVGHRVKRSCSISLGTQLSDQRGWIPFKECCDVVCARLPDAPGILAARREGVTGPQAVRIFVHAFEAAIALSRDEAVWEALKNNLSLAGREIRFDRPRTPKNIIGIDAGPTADPRSVFDSFARCLACAIGRSKTIPPDPEILAREFDRCRTAWESAVIEYDIIAPISGIHVAGFDGIDLAHGLRLTWDSALTEPARYHIESNTGMQFRGRPPVVLLGRRAFDKGTDPELLVNRIVSEVTQCVTAIRLATGRIVGCDFVHILISESHFQTFNAVANYTWFLPQTAIYGDSAGLGQALTDAEAESTRHVSTLLSGVAGAELEIAVERFNLAAGRQTLEDQVIDLAIALESTICRGGGGEQLSYRFRVFGAAVLADVLDAAHVLQMLGKLYAARSKVVHAGKRLSDIGAKDLAGCAAPQFVGECRELTRRILLEFLEQAARGCPPDKYVKELERSMILSAKKSHRDPRDDSCA